MFFSMLCGLVQAIKFKEIGPDISRSFTQRFSGSYVQQGPKVSAWQKNRTTQVLDNNGNRQTWSDFYNQYGFGAINPKGGVWGKTSAKRAKGFSIKKRGGAEKGRVYINRFDNYPQNIMGQSFYSRLSPQSYGQQIRIGGGPIYTNCDDGRCTAYAP